MFGSVSGSMPEPLSLTVTQTPPVSPSRSWVLTAIVPPVGIEQCQAGDLSWWLDKIDTYKTVAGCINGFARQ